MELPEDDLEAFGGQKRNGPRRMVLRPLPYQERRVIVLRFCPEKRPPRESEF